MTWSARVAAVSSILALGWAACSSNAVEPPSQVGDACTDTCGAGLDCCDGFCYDAEGAAGGCGFSIGSGDSCTSNADCGTGDVCNENGFCIEGTGGAGGAGGMGGAGHGGSGGATGGWRAWGDRGMRSAGTGGTGGA